MAKEMVLVYFLYDPRKGVDQEEYEEYTDNKFHDATTQDLLYYDREKIESYDISIHDLIEHEKISWKVVKVDDAGNIVE